MMRSGEDVVMGACEQPVMAPEGYSFVVLVVDLRRGPRGWLGMVVDWYPSVVRRLEDAARFDWRGDAVHHIDLAGRWDGTRFEILLVADGRVRR